MNQEIQPNLSENPNSDQQWSLPEDIKNFGSTNSPALASSDTNLYIAFKGKSTGRDGDQKIYIAAYDDTSIGNGWSDSTPASYEANNFNTGKSPAITVFNNKLFLAWRAYQDENLAIAYTVDLSSAPDAYNFWAYKAQLDFTSSKPPALTVFNDKLFMAWEGDNDHEIRWSSSVNGEKENWDDSKKTGFSTDQSPALVAFKDKLYLAWKGKDGNNMGLAYLNETTQKWTKVKIAYKTSGAPSLSVYNDYLFIAFKDANSIDIYYGSSSDGSFPDENSVQVLYAYTDGHPSMAVYAGSLSMAYDVKADEQLKSCYYPKTKLP